MDGVTNDPFPSIKDAARGDTSRASDAGRQLGEQTYRLFVAPGLAKLEADGQRDERCGTCAYRVGTIPNACIQTQSDALKAGMEGVPFLCHAHTDAAGNFDRTCHGWYAMRVTMRGLTVHAPWDFSPPDTKP